MSKLSGKKSDVVLRFLQRCAAFQASRDLKQLGRSFKLLTGDTEGNPVLSCFVRIPETGWHDTNDGEALAIQPYLPAENMRIAAETLLPQAVTDNDYRSGRSTDLYFVVAKNTAESRRNTQRREQRRTDGLPYKSRRIITRSLSSEVLPNGHRDTYRLKLPGPFLPCKVIRNRSISVARCIANVMGAERHEAVGFGKRQIQMLKCMGGAQDGGIRPDPKRQCNRSDCSQHSMLAHHAEPIKQILPEIMNPGDAPLVPTLFPDDGEISEGTSRVPSRQVGVHARLDVLQHKLVEVECQFLVQLIVQLTLSKQRLE